MKKKIIKPRAIVAIIFSCAIGGLISDSVSAISNITYQTSTDPTFTINPSLNVSLSSPDLVISDLVPGQSSDSNIITINVESNNQTGYVLNSSVGNNTAYNTDALVNSNDYNATFTNMTTTGSLSAGEWGYSYATYDTDSSTWSSWSNYAGLPLYNGTAKTLATSPTHGTTTVQFKIGAYADTDQPSGEYNNLINFTVVGNAIPITLYQAFYEASQNDPTITQKNGYYKMQDMSPTICSAVSEIPSEMQLIDIRDDEVYLIGKLADGRCWMKDNLRLGSNESTTTLTSQDSNISGDTYTLPQGITSGFDSFTTANINAAHKNDTNVTSYGNGSGKVGVYYNYCAASAGTYCYAQDAGTGDAQYDVCPANWRIPTSGSNGEYKTLYMAYHSDNTNFRNSLSVLFSGGFFGSSQVNLDSRGSFWSSTYYNSDKIYILFIMTPDLVDPANESSGDIYRNSGNTIRCIANN